MLHTTKSFVANLPMSYAINNFVINKTHVGIVASEGKANCFMFSLMPPYKQDVIWHNAGGTMSIAQLSDDGSFLAVQNFFKGFNSKTACIVHATPKTGSWEVKKILDLPYVHRMDVINIKGQNYIVAATLCEDKKYKEDWRSPGRVWLGEIMDNGEIKDLTILIPSITKNHGFYKGKRNGRNIILITGMDGIFEIQIPTEPDLNWTYEQIIEGEEISDVAVVDIDNDGIDELVTINGFHGDKIAINKFLNGKWEEVYSYPVKFGHVVWGGDVLGRKSIIIGYREANAALMLLQKKAEGWPMEHFVIDELIGPTNISVLPTDKECKILCSCGKTQEIVVYEITQ